MKLPQISIWNGALRLWAAIVIVCLGVVVWSGVSYALRVPAPMRPDDIKARPPEWTSNVEGWDSAGKPVFKRSEADLIAALVRADAESDYATARQLAASIKELRSVKAGEPLGLIFDTPEGIVTAPGDANTLEFRTAIAADFTKKARQKHYEEVRSSVLSNLKELLQFGLSSLALLFIARWVKRGFFPLRQAQ
ncbi:MAG: hypothetical protein AB7M12_04480 [Hyphomonadaceae bacterium]